MTAEESTRLTLYTYWRSSAAYRVRIALNLKGLAFRSIPVNLVSQGGEQHGESFRSVNPMGHVPVLVDGEHVITQSMAICEYLDEIFEQYPLLPADPLARARVRSLALQVACEIHPVNNLRIQNYLKDKGGDQFDTLQWMRHWMETGFAAIEQQLSDLSERPGLFECFLIPQVYNAERFGVDMTMYPLIGRIVKRCRALVAFIDASPEKQPDAPPV